MKGYISYSNTSNLSPAYPNPVTINEKSYISPSIAIQSGEDPLETILLHIRSHPEIYRKYRDYKFEGLYSDYLNQAIDLLYLPRREPIQIEKYVKILPMDIHKRISLIDIEYTIPIIRSVYVYSSIGNDILKPVSTLDATEEYRVFLILDTPIYVGTKGSFILLDNPQMDTSLILEELRKI